MRRPSIGLVVVIGTIAANYLPLLSMHSEQDNCSFGPVSNAEYRDYRTRAAALVPAFVPSLYQGGDALALQFDDVLQSLSKGEDGIYRRLAIMHAIMRAAGAEYRNTNGNNPDRGRSDAFSKAIKETSTISFNYVLDVNRLLIFWPWPRDAWIIASLAGPRYSRPLGPLYPKRIGDIAFIVHPPDPLMWPGGYDERRDNACPPVPAPDKADSFSRSAKVE